jgi:hypothetical protein
VTLNIIFSKQIPTSFQEHEFFEVYFVSCLSANKSIYTALLVSLKWGVVDLCNTLSDYYNSVTTVFGSLYTQCWYKTVFVLSPIGGWSIFSCNRSCKVVYLKPLTCFDKYIFRDINPLSWFDIHAHVREWLTLLVVRHTHVRSVWQCRKPTVSCTALILNGL